MLRKYRLASVIVTAFWGLAVAQAASERGNASLGPITSTVHLGDGALDWQDALIARDPDGHTALISGAPVRLTRTTSQE